MKKQKEPYRVVQTLWGKRKTVKKDMTEEDAHRHVAVMRRATGHAVEYHGLSNVHQTKRIHLIYHGII